MKQDNFRIRRPYDLRIDEALVSGKTQFPAAPDGLYLRRMAKELDGAIDVEPFDHNVFRATRAEMVIKKVYEGCRYSVYERVNKKWSELV
jgi:hypothetical protein